MSTPRCTGRFVLLVFAACSCAISANQYQEPCRCPASDGVVCVRTPAGCVAIDPDQFPHGKFLSSFGHVLPDQESTLSSLSAGRNVVMVAPPSAHLPVSISRALPQSLAVIHHLPFDLDTVRTSFESNGRNVRLYHGVVSNQPGNAQAVQIRRQCGSLLDYFRGGRQATQLEEVPVLTLSQLLNNQAGDPRMIIIQDPPNPIEAVSAATKMCIGDCILAVSLPYDGEGVVFGSGSLAVLSELSTFEKNSAGTACFFHMSDWVSKISVQVDHASQDYAHLAPHLDIICLPPPISYGPPPSTRLHWRVFGCPGAYTAMPGSILSCDVSEKA